MSDPIQAAVWLAVLVTGLAGGAALNARGLATTYVRDLLHVGAGLWILGWPAWQGRLVPVAITVAAVALVLSIPPLARRTRWAARLRDSVARGDERYSGLVFYTVSFAVLTAAGLGGEPWPAAAALLALSLGDGIGGAVGRRFGRRGYRLPWGKDKTWLGSATVAVMAAIGAAFASWWLDAGIGLAAVASVGLAAALAEALAPRGTDNVLVPAAAWTAALIVI